VGKAGRKGLLAIELAKEEEQIKYGMRRGVLDMWLVPSYTVPSRPERKLHIWVCPLQH
jgi:hypothetical protein